MHRRMLFIALSVLSAPALAQTYIKVNGLPPIMSTPKFTIWFQEYNNSGVTNVYATGLPGSLLIARSISGSSDPAPWTTPFTPLSAVPLTYTDGGRREIVSGRTYKMRADWNLETGDELFVKVSLGGPPPYYISGTTVTRKRSWTDVFSLSFYWEPGNTLGQNP